MSKIYMVVNQDRFFLSHRKPVAKAAKDSGNEVIIVTKNTGHIETIHQLGFKTIDLPINPTGMHIGEELKTFRFLYNLYRKDKPDIVHHVGLKNILWGGLAAKFAGINGVVNAVSGLGGLFNDGKLSSINRMILKVMKYSNRRSNVKVIFQNNDDLDIFQSQNVVNTDQIEFIKESGIDLKEFAFSTLPIDNPIKIIFTGRMVKEKGVCDLIAAAEQLKSEFNGRLNFFST